MYAADEFYDTGLLDSSRSTSYLRPRLMDCKRCGNKLHSGMRMYNYGHRWLCSDCLLTTVRNHAEDNDDESLFDIDDADDMADVLEIEIVGVWELMEEEDELYASMRRYD